MIKKIKEIEQGSNDIYFCETVSGKFIVNNNYSGVLIYNDNLELLTKLNLFDDLIIYNSFINHNNEEILLYCYDNRKLIYINIASYEYRIINIADQLIDIIFSRIYEWLSDGIILSSYNNNFFKVDFINERIQLLEIEVIKNDMKNFYKIYNLYLANLNCGYTIIDKIKFNYKNILIIYNNKDYILNILGYDHNDNLIDEKINLKIDINFHDILFCEKDSIIAASENEIKVFRQNTIKRLKINNKYIYLKSRILNKNNEKFLLVLIGCNSDTMYSKIIKYKIM